MNPATKPKKVEVYLNKRKMGKSKARVYSIRDAASKKVILTHQLILLQNVELVVQESGRQNTLRQILSQGRFTKYVHAFLRGELVKRGRSAKLEAKLHSLTAEQGADSVRYNPTEMAQWQTSTGQPVFLAQYAFLHTKGIQVK